MDDTSIQVFSSQQFGELRALKGSDGEPWFVAKDVCDVLEIRTDTIRRILDDDEVDETNPNTIGVAGGRNPLIVSEAGLYNLVLRSRKPESLSVGSLMKSFRQFDVLVATLPPMDLKAMKNYWLVQS